jgi:hypothetical protein
MRKNCTECQFGEMKFNDLTPLDDSYLPYKGAAYVKCGQGKGDTILAFYGRNGDKPTREVTE